METRREWSHVDWHSNLDIGAALHPLKHYGSCTVCYGALIHWDMPLVSQVTKNPWESHPVPWSNRDQALLKVSLILVRTWGLNGCLYSEIWPPNCMYQIQWKGLYPWPWPSPLWLSPKGINSKAISQCLYVRNLTCWSLPGEKTLASIVGKERISRIIKPQKFWVSQQRPDHLGSTQEKHTYTLCIWLVLDFYSWTV